MSKNYAYISLLGSDNYIGAAIVLMYSGKQTNSQYPFYLLVTKQISEENKRIIKALGYRIILVDEYQPSQMTEYLNKENASNSCKHGYGTKDEDKGGRHAYTKIMAGNLTQFDKICYIDLDILVLQNLDDVFAYPNLSTPGWGHTDGSCNSLFMIIEPNKQIYNRILEYAKTIKPHDRPIADDCYILSGFFKESLCNRSCCIPELYCYNGFDFQDNNHQLLFDFPKIKSVHMTGGYKPGLHGEGFINHNMQGEVCKIGEEIQLNYLAIFIGKFYIALLNQGIQDLQQLGFALPFVL